LANGSPVSRSCFLIRSREYKPIISKQRRPAPKLSSYGPNHPWRVVRSRCAGALLASMVNATAPGTDGSERESGRIRRTELVAATGDARLVELVDVLTRGDNCRTTPEPGGVT
jgi:hypothetical protein